MDSVFEFEDWVYKLLPIDKPLPTTDEDLIRFNALWHSRICPPSDLPQKSAFAFEDFVGLHGWVAIEKVMQDSFDLLPVLHGTELREVDGSDFTNMLISQHNSDPRLHKHDVLFIKLSELAAENRCPYYCAGTSVQNHKSYFDEWFGFPTVCEENQVSHFYSVLRRTAK